MSPESHPTPNPEAYLRRTGEWYYHDLAVKGTKEVISAFVCAIDCEGREGATTNLVNTMLARRGRLTPLRATMAGLVPPREPRESERVVASLAQRQTFVSRSWAEREWGCSSDLADVGVLIFEDAISNDGERGDGDRLPPAMTPLEAAPLMMTMEFFTYGGVPLPWLRRAVEEFGVVCSLVSYTLGGYCASAAQLAPQGEAIEGIAREDFDGSCWGDTFGGFLSRRGIQWDGLIAPPLDAPNGPPDIPYLAHHLRTNQETKISC